MSPLEHPTWRIAPPPGGVFNLDDVADDVAMIEASARALAIQRGYRPRSRIIATSNLDEYELLVGEPPLAVAGARRGLCGPGPAGARVIWVAPARRCDLVETLTHEYAHAVLPLREHHTVDWLAIHVATLARVSSPEHVERVRRRCVDQYDL